jgi:hypothetical protein
MMQGEDSDADVEATQTRNRAYWPEGPGTLREDYEEPNSYWEMQ